MKIQHKIKNGRDIVKGYTIARIRSKIEDLAAIHDCSQSFVVDTLLADQLGIKLEERYDEIRKDVRRTRKGKK
jgi:hypothetical protein